MTKATYVLCPDCKKKIHINDFAGVVNVEGKPGFFHELCLILRLEATHDR